MKKLFLLIFLITSYDLFAMKLGVGICSLTAGRTHPLAYLSFDPGRFSWTLSSVGFKHQFGYFSGYNTAFFYNFGTRGYEAGLGAGVTYISESFRDSSDEAFETHSTWSAGPSVKAFWRPSDYLFIGLQGTFGVGLTTLYGLALQDHVAFVLGGAF